jgi:hypothetical protein
MVASLYGGRRKSNSARLGLCWAGCWASAAAVVQVKMHVHTSCWAGLPLLLGPNTSACRSHGWAG